jgi:N6-adenosine-specific RNA methylase IME4
MTTRNGGCICGGSGDDTEAAAMPPGVSPLDVLALGPTRCALQALRPGDREAVTDQARAAVRYRTIVADPPWDMNTLRRKHGGSGWRAGIGQGRSGQRELPYPTLTLNEISALPVRSLACADSQLWLWTTHGFLWDAPRVAEKWGFQLSFLLVWAKPGLGVGGRFRHTCEYLLFCERGRQLPVTRRDLPTHFLWPRGVHSQKPEAFYDLVEVVSPSPYLELFARRQRLGWDTWGNEALNHVELAG